MSKPNYLVHKTNKYDIKYRVVPKSWRSAVEKRDMKGRRRKSPTSPLVLELLSGKTLFVVGDKTTYGRVPRPFATGIYSTAKTHGKRLRVYHYEDIDNDEYGFICWMDKAAG